MINPFIIINGRFLTQPITGMQRYAAEMVAALFNLRCDYRFLIVAPPGTLERRPSGFYQDRFPVGGQAWEQLRLPWLVKKLRGDLLWCPCNTAPLVNSTPLVVTVADASVFAGPQWFSPRFRLYYRVMLPLLGRVARKVVTISKFSQQELSRYGLVRDKNKLKVTYCGVTPLLRKGHSQGRKASLLGERAYVLTLGSLDPRKNLRRLLEAWERLPETVKQGRVLTISGKYNPRTFADELYSPGRDVIFLGYVPDEELSGLYSQADAFVFPSLYEGFGLPPLEAMTCGTPVLVAQTASLPEVCGEAALYCDPYSVEDITAKLTLILTDKSLRGRLRHRGPEQAKKFTWERGARQLLEVFREVLHGSIN
jgi:glycosyltransferase involved in cell wall biosynthesis